MDIFHRLNQEEGKTIVLITHSNELAEETQRIITLKDGAGLTATVIANDGIAVVVNNDNPIDELTSDQVKSVFTGETTTWADLEK